MTVRVMGSKLYPLSVGVRTYVPLITSVKVKTPVRSVWLLSPLLRSTLTPLTGLMPSVI